VIFLTHLHITNVDQADILLEILLPVFTTARELLTPSIYQSIASLFVFHPHEALNLFSHFVKNTVDFNDSFWSVIRLYMSLWPLFTESVYADPYLRILTHLFSKSTELHRELSGIIARFQAVAQSKSLAILFLAKVSPESLILDPQVQVQLVESPHHRSVFLRLPELAASPALAEGLIRNAVGSGDVTAWAILLKYARLSEEHARTIVCAGGWFDVTDPEHCF
jgi:hypothetical protein